MNLSEPILRQATIRDAAELARLRWDFSLDQVTTGDHNFTEFERQFEEFLKRVLESGDWTIWVAEQGRRLIANIYLQIVHKVPRPGQFSNRFGYLTNAYVEPDFRDRGIGSCLLQRVIEGARQQRLEFVILWPSEASIRFYERAGFVPSPEALEHNLRPGI